MGDKDHILVKKVLNGDSAAFAELIERYAGLVHGLVLERIRRPDEVEDLMQEIFAKAYTHLSGLRQPNRFGPWIATIAANLATNWWQKNRNRLEAERQGQDYLFSNRTSGPEEKFEGRQAISVVWEALDRLPPEYRRVVVLYHLEGCAQRDIARFMKISIHTVKWRLYQAQRRMQTELGAILSQEIGYRFGQSRHLKEKLLAGLPVMPLFRVIQPAGFFGHWFRRTLVFLAGAGLFALSGLLLLQKIQSQQEDTQDQRRSGGFAVRYQPMDLPKASVLWTPSRPQAGERVRLKWASAALADEEAVYLHYTTDLDEPRDQVVQMQRDAASWLATVQLPTGATNLFFYAAPEAQPQHFDSSMERSIQLQQVQRYTNALAVYNNQGWPVRNAEYNLGTWSATLKYPAAEGLQHFNRELFRYPDHARANSARWYALQDGARNLDAAYARVQAEKIALATRFPDDPELAWAIIGHSGDKEALRAFVSRFPDHKNAPAAAYRTTLFPRGGEYQAQTQALRQFLAAYPHSAYTDDAYRDLLWLHHHHNRLRGKALADSLISRRLVPYFELEKERRMDRWALLAPFQGTLPEGQAYTLRFKWYLEEGDTTAALKLARRLVGSGLQDPIPYVHLGQHLTKSANTRDLGIEILEVGLPWTDLDHMFTLPWFALPEESAMRPYRRKRMLEWRISCLQQLGTAYLERGDCAGAAHLLGESTALQSEYLHNDPPFDDRAFLLLGQAQSCLGAWDEATEAYLSLVQRFYHHPAAENALEDLHRQRYGNLSRWRSQRAAAWPPSPPFTAGDAAGDTLHLSDLGGQPVLLFCDWRQPHPRRQPDLEQLATWHHHYAGRGAKVLFATRKTTYYSGAGNAPYRSEDRLAAQVQKQGYPFRRLFVDDETHTRYATVPGGLVLFLVDRAGRLRLRQDRNHFYDRQKYNRILENKLEDLLREHLNQEGQRETLVSRPEGN